MYVRPQSIVDLMGTAPKTLNEVVESLLKCERITMGEFRRLNALDKGNAGNWPLTDVAWLIQLNTHYMSPLTRSEGVARGGPVFSMEQRSNTVPPCPQDFEGALEWSRTYDVQPTMQPHASPQAGFSPHLHPAAQPRIATTHPSQRPPVI